MVTLIRKVHVFAPQDLGTRDVAILGERIVAMGDDLSKWANIGDARIIEGKERYLIPGFVDAHVHILGGGGAAGFGSRGPEMTFSEAVLAGTTTVLGCVGADQVGRDLWGLLAKTKSLEFRGMTAKMLTGGFDWRTTLTGSIIKDIFAIDNVIGAKVAISDRRSFHPTQDELNRIVADTMHGSLLSGKAGVLQVHVGDLESGITPLIRAVKETGVPIKHVWPTHFNRNELLMEQALDWTRIGGTVDLTPSIAPPDFKRGTFSTRALKQFLGAGVSIDQITVSTDGGGVSTIHGFDKVERFPLDLLFREFKELIQTEGLAVTDALKVTSTNVARMMKLERKGVIAEGADADLILLDPATLGIKVVIVRGKIAVEDDKIMVTQKLDV
jgi:beta-aspartyl-dipeptidase (metallo-type)